MSLKNAQQVKGEPDIPKLSTITGTALMEKEIPEPSAVVPGFFVARPSCLVSSWPSDVMRRFQHLVLMRHRPSPV